MSASIIILNYNNAEETAEYVGRICEYKCLDHVIIVDNASTDDSAARLKPLCTGKVELVESAKTEDMPPGIISGCAMCAISTARMVWR